MKYTLLKRSLLKWKCLRLLSAQFKMCQIAYANFETASRFLSKFCMSLQFLESLLLCVCVCVYVCVYVCVCVCLCVYTHPSVGFFRLHDVFDKCEKFGSTIFYCEYSDIFCQVPSSLFLNLSYFTSKEENSSHLLTGEKTIWYNVRRQRWYILI